MTPNTKVFYNGAPINQPRKKGKFTTPWYKRFISYMWRMTKITVSALVAAAILIQVGATFFSTHTIEAQTIQVPQTFPVLDRIAKCESGNHQFAPSGQVLMRANTNKTVDVGRFQINTVWFAKATELGYDVTTEEGNTKMAEWIYTNKGTGAWSSSAKCWNK